MSYAARRTIRFELAITPLIVGILILSGFSTLPANAIPAFARKYSLPCSSCHEAWPKLNNFGQVFRDNGYQLGNDRDAPLTQGIAYWPITFRITPQWHRESNERVAVETFQVIRQAARLNNASQLGASTFQAWTYGLRVLSSKTFLL